jgi:hypothetical protein
LNAALPPKVCSSGSFAETESGSDSYEPESEFMSPKKSPSGAITLGVSWSSQYIRSTILR